MTNKSIDLDELERLHGTWLAEKAKNADLTALEFRRELPLGALIAYQKLEDALLLKVDHIPELIRLARIGQEIEKLAKMTVDM